MIEQTIVEHHIQKHILDVLIHQKFARFRDLRPQNIDTNLYAYHLKLLQKNNHIDKTTDGYTLATKGLVYADRVSTLTGKNRTQPKIVSMLVVQNSNGDILLHRRGRQPFAELWTLPQGKLHVDDESITAAAEREVIEKLALTPPQTIVHAGDCYVRIYDTDDILFHTFCHVFRFNSDDIVETDDLKWARPHKLSTIPLAPAVEKIIARTFFNDPYFFEEYDEELLH